MGFLANLMGIGQRREKIILALQEGAVIIDVRTPAEFGHSKIQDSVNVPLDIIGQSVKKLKNLNKPLILCCESGVRSVHAVNILKQNGLENVINGGGWRNVNGLKRTLDTSKIA